ncbi:MAG: cytochrome b [Rhizobacter sp.]|nr:cytochrome b [Burkholderiaceae bacterium]MCO5122491.1 cytochrome b [Rhizobacter sp.]
MSRPPRYTTIAIGLHWLLAAAILTSLVVGNFMSDLPISPLRLKLVNWHKWAGVTILALSLLRLAWRLTHRPPPDVPMARWQRNAAHATHVVMYVLFFAVPLAGWAYSSASGFPVVWFGVLALPDFVAPDKALAASLKTVHALLAYTLAALVAVHVAAAIKHQLVDHDGLLARMGLGRG